MIVFESLHEFQDAYYEQLLLNEVLNENLSIEDIKGLVSKIKDKKKVLNSLIEKFNSTKTSHIKKTILIAILALMSISDPLLIDTISKTLSNYPTIDLTTVAQEITQFKSEPAVPSVPSPFKKIMDFETSEETKNLIKDHEKLSLVAYSIDDRMVTIGYGHAEYASKTELVPGVTTISEEEAEELFKKDIKEKEDGVKRMLVSWARNGYNLDNINQSMFDAMVSMSFNMGTYGLISSEFATALQNTNSTEDILNAAEIIKCTS
jgi:GH24 family phage-related lysozyme (muramidase)